MRIPLLAILAFSVSCSQVQHKRSPSSESNPVEADCYRDICNGDEIFDYSIGKVSESHGVIKDIHFQRWAPMGGDGIMIPYGKVQYANGQVKEEVDVRYLVKYPIESKCTYRGDQRFCQGDKVIVIPRASWGERDIFPTKIFAILPSAMSDSPERILTIDPKDKTKYLANQQIGLGQDGTCFDKQHDLCIGDSYDNGLGSKDTILGYFPLNDVFSIRAGDIGGTHSLFRKDLIARKSGEYRVVRSLKNQSYAHASINGKKNETAASEEAVREAQKKCGYEFLGQGILDPNDKAQPEVKNCDRKVQGGGISHGRPYGPSIMVTCEVKYEFTCVHKKKLK